MSATKTESSRPTTDYLLPPPDSLQLLSGEQGARAAIETLKTPTDEFSFVLKPSGIHGVGVFATHPIAKGSSLRLFVDVEAVREVPMDHPRADVLVRNSIIMDTHFVCADDFGRMSIGWYLNHSDHPNAGHENYEYFAKEDIAADAELTIDYETLW
jgi:hypothetical protein